MGHIMKNRQARRLFKQNIDFFMERIDCSDYLHFCEKMDKESKESYRRYVEDNHPNLAARIDCYDESDRYVSNCIIYDVLSNDGVATLVKKLYELPDNEYKITNYYKKQTMLNRYDYVHLQCTRYGLGTFAEIKLIKDPFIDTIHITWTQINSSEAFFEYNINFKKCLDKEMHDEFIKLNIRKVDPAVDYYVCYKLYDDYQHDFLTLSQLEDDYFILVCQHYITSLLFSEQGKMDELPSITVMTRKEHINMDTIELSAFSNTFYNRRENYYICNGFREDRYVLCAGDNHIPQFRITNYISKYGNEFYKIFFGRWELKIFERDFSKFFSGRKMAWYNKEYYKLLNKLKGMSEIENRNYSDFCERFKNDWEFYCGDESMEIDELLNKETLDLRKIYSENFDFLKLKTEANCAKIEVLSSIAAVFASIVAIIISVID